MGERSGEIRTLRRIDRELICRRGARPCTVVFDVVARPLKYFQIIRVVVHIDDVNDNTPTFPQDRLTLRIAESRPTGSLSVFDDSVVAVA